MASKYGKTNLRKHGSPFIRDNSKVKTVEDNAIDISEDSDSYLEQLAKKILANWYEAVDADLKKYPFSEEELSKVSDKHKKRYMSGQRQEKAYGTTLIAA